MTQHITLQHGAGGKAMVALIEKVFLKAFHNVWLNQQEDQATLYIPHHRIVMSTDSHVVSPLFFPGGDIGSLSVYGTVNDLAMAGAVPLYLSVGFIIEEGFPVKELQRIARSMADAAKASTLSIVTGDTKVVEKGKGDGVFINTTGIGYVPESVSLSHHIQKGDKILISGSVGDHGIAVMSKRENLSFQTKLLSDTQPLHDLVSEMLKAVPDIRCMRDPTRGGISATLNEWAHQHQIGIELQESSIPYKNEVLAACELLGLDPLNVANEGKLMAICPADKAAQLLTCMQSHSKGKHAALIGEVIEIKDPFVQMQTGFGGYRMVDWLSGDQLPRIC